MLFSRPGNSLRAPFLAAGLLTIATGNTPLLAQSSSPASAADRVAGWAGKSRAEVAALVPGAEQDYRVLNWHGWREVQLTYALVGGVLPERLVKARFSFAAPVSAVQARAAAVERLGLEADAVVQTIETDTPATVADGGVDPRRVARLAVEAEERQAAAGRRGYFAELSSVGGPGNTTSAAGGSATTSVTVFFQPVTTTESR